MNQIDKLFIKIQAMPKSKKMLCYGLAVFAILLSYLSIACLIGVFIRSVKALSDGPLRSIFWYGLVDKSGRTISIIMCIIVTAIILIIYYRINYRNSVTKTDERGVEFMEKGTHGTSIFMSKDEAQQIYEVTNIDNTLSTIYGQYTENGEQVVAYKQPTKGGEGNMNNCIIGSPGTGKSYVFVRTELLQTIRRNESFICTDPSTEIYTSLSKYCRNQGYDVKVLNLANPSYSDCWDCLEETIDPETERLDGTRLNEFVNIYMKNSSDEEGKSEQKFWFDCATNLLTAVVGLCAYEREIEIIEQYKKIYSKIANECNYIDNDGVCIKMNKASFKWSRNKILKLAETFGYDIGEINELFKKINDAAPIYNIASVYDYIMKFDSIEEKFSYIPEWHPARIAYNIFETNSTSETVRSSALQGAQMRLQIFSDEKIRYMLSHKGMHLSDCNKVKTAIFVIMSDKSTSTKPISSLVFSFLFKDAQDEYDIAQQKAEETHTPNPRLPITVMLDEFFSIGVIGGNPKSFAVTMSNSRKRKLHVSIIIQAYPQVRALYGVDNAMTILNCCGTVIFLGCNDPETAKFISDFISGDSTVLAESHDEISGFMANAGNSVKMSSTTRKLLTIDEARRWKNMILVAKAGEHPLKLNPFPWKSHPAYKYTEEESVFSSIKKIDQEIENEFYAEKTDMKQREEIDKQIKELKGIKIVNKETGEIEEIQAN